MRALRRRRQDIPLLFDHFVKTAAVRHDVTPRPVPPETLAALQAAEWPGNVRELENAIQRGLALAGSRSELAAEDLLPMDSRWRGANEVTEDVEPLRSVLRGAEIRHIQHVLELTGGHRSQAADLLGISRKVLWEKVRDFGIQAPGDDD